MVKALAGWVFGFVCGMMFVVWTLHVVDTLVTGGIFK